MPGAGRKPPEIRRQEIVDTLIELAATRGFESITVRDLADAAGVTPGLIHHYFAGMDALLADAFDQWASQRQDQLWAELEHLPPTDQLARLVVSRSVSERLWHDALTAAARFEELRRRAFRLNEDYRKIVLGIIERGVDEGAFLCDDPVRSAWRIILMLDGSMAVHHAFRPFETDELAMIIGPVVEHDLSLAPGTLVSSIELAGHDLQGRLAGGPDPQRGNGADERPRSLDAAAGN
jgi:AcrR family transcriptional regulator